MRLRFGKKLSLALTSMAVAAAGSLVFMNTALAATGLVYLTPSNPTVNTGDQLTVSVRINPGTSISGVEATLNYDPTKLQYVSVNTANSGFSVQLQQSQASGTVTMVRGDFTTGGISADSLIETVTFTALGTTGSSALSLTNANATDSATSTYTNPSTTGALVNFSTPVVPPATCPSGQTGVPPNCVIPPVNSGGGNSGTTKPTTGSSSKSSAGATTNPSASQPASVPTGATIATVTDKKIAYTSATLTVTSKDPTQVYIRFGLSGTLDQQTPVSDFATSHTIALDPRLLIPGQTYSYVIVATNQQGVVSQTAPATFTTSGLKISVVVVDKNKKPLAGRIVTLHSSPVTGKTDSKGAVTFSGVTPGTHHVVYVVGKTTYSKDIQVLNNVQGTGTTQTATTQNFSVVYDLTESSLPMARIWLAIILLVLIAVAVLAQTGRLGVAFQMHRTSGDPLVIAPVVIGANPPAPVATSQGTSTVPASAPATESAPTPSVPRPVPILIKPESEVVAEHLEAIPDPTKPKPGSLVVPETAETEPATDQESPKLKRL